MSWVKVRIDKVLLQIIRRRCALTVLCVAAGVMAVAAEVQTERMPLTQNGKSAAAGVVLGKDVLDLRDRVILNAKAITHYSQDWLSYRTVRVPHPLLADEVTRIGAITDGDAARKKQAASLARELEILVKLRDEVLPKVGAIEKRIKQARNGASPKTGQSLDLMQRLIDDTRSNYATAVPDSKKLDEYLKTMQTIAEAGM